MPWCACVRACVCVRARVCVVVRVRARVCVVEDVKEQDCYSLLYMRPLQAKCCFLKSEQEPNVSFDLFIYFLDIHIYVNPE